MGMGVASTDNEMEMVHLKNQSVEEAELAAKRSRKRNRRCCILCGSCCCLTLMVVLVTVVTLVLVFKPKNPIINVQNVTLDSFDANVNLIPPSFKLNLTLGIAVAVTNPNKVRFKYSNSTAFLMYRGNQVGLLPIPPGEVGPGGTEVISSSLNVLADRLVSNGNIITDLVGGSLPFSTTTDISGRVTVLGIIHHHVRAIAKCDVTVLTSRSIKDMECRYDIKL